MEKQLMINMDILSPSLMMEIQLPLDLGLMMALLLMQVMFVCMTGMELTGLNGAKTLMERQVVTGLDIQSPSLMMEIQWPLELRIMMALVQMLVMFMSMTGMEQHGLNVDKTLTERLAVTGMDFLSVSLMMAVLLPLELGIMMALLLMQVMFGSMSGMERHGINGAKTLMEKDGVTILDFLSPSLMMEIQWPLEHLSMMALLLMQVMFVYMTGMEQHGLNGAKTLTERRVVTILEGLSPSLQTEIQLPLELILMMELLLMPVMFVSMTGMELTGISVAKTLMEKQLMINLDILSPSLMMEIQWPLELGIMMAVLLMRVMCVFMTGMELTGLNGAKTLTERRVVTILDFLSPSLTMEIQWPLEQYLMMALLLMQVMFVYIIITGRWAIMMVMTICVG
jgi:hypothetical protein